ncbi:DUF2283 domain-containing protein [Bacillus sp. FSL K6-0067]|uniref:DUF2283 domain-containing protein n=1 Tax=Bacillus sp. FSL K6-0067 TaxID=2921412 RepID=UPI00077A1818|nr:DUF2283 domain-containing protein [Bacillus cereus]KXY25951.1 hypothetical protein AT267_27180 [Bacillus cereus]
MDLITYDNEAQMGYMQVIPFSSNIQIESTDELDENAPIMIDIDNQGRIVGIEFFGKSSDVLKELVKQKKIYHKKHYEDKIIYSFRVNSNAYLKMVSLKGINFYFEDEMCTSFIGFDVIEVEKYDKCLLDSMSF